MKITGINDIASGKITNVDDQKHLYPNLNKVFTPSNLVPTSVVACYYNETDIDDIFDDMREILGLRDGYATLTMLASEMGLYNDEDMGLLGIVDKLLVPYLKKKGCSAWIISAWEDERKLTVVSFQ